MDSSEQYLDQIAGSLCGLGAVRLDSDSGPFGFDIDDMMVFVGPPTTMGSAVAEVGAILLLDHSNYDELAPVLAEAAAVIPSGTVLETRESPELGWTVWLIGWFDPDDFEQAHLKAKLETFRESASAARRIIDDRLFTEIIEASLTDEYEVIETVDRRVWHVDLDGRRLRTTDGIGAACSFAYDQAQSQRRPYKIKVVYLHEDAKYAQFFDGAVYFKFPNTYFDANGNFIEDTES